MEVGCIGFVGHHTIRLWISMLPLGFGRGRWVYPFKNWNLFEVNSRLHTNYCHKIPNIEPPTLEDYFFQENKPGVFLNCQLWNHSSCHDKQKVIWAFLKLGYLHCKWWGSEVFFVSKNRGLSSTLLLFAHVLHVWHVELRRQMEGCDTSAGKMHVWHVELKSLNASMWYHRWKDGWGHKMS
jgi:hypothetical protein